MSRRTRIFAVTFVTSIAIAIPLACLLRPDAVLARILASHLRSQLEDSSAEEADYAASRLAAFEVGLRELVDALDSPRSTTRNAALDAINSTVDGWRQLDSPVSSEHAGRLAALLAQRAPAFGPNGRAASISVTRRLLAWPIEPTSMQFIDHCEAILRTEGTAGVSETNTNLPSSGEPAGWVHREADITPEYAIDDESMRLAGGGIEVNPVVLEHPAGPNHEAPADEPAADEAPLAVEPWELAAPAPQPLSTSQAPTLLNRPDPIVVSPADPQRTGDPLQPGGLANIELIRNLRATSDGKVESATVELIRRGFSQRDIQLARELVHPDPARRVRLVQLIPTLAGIDPRPWLLWLSADEDSDVRRAAITTMATSAAPAFQDRLKEIEQTELDPDLLRVVRQILGRSARR